MENMWSIFNKIKLIISKKNKNKTYYGQNEIENILKREDILTLGDMVKVNIYDPCKIGLIDQNGNKLISKRFDLSDKELKRLMIAGILTRKSIGINGVYDFIEVTTTIFDAKTNDKYYRSCCILLDEIKSITKISV